MKKQQLYLMLSELAWLLQSGIHLLAALNLLAKQSALAPSKGVIQQCALKIQQGQALSLALQPFLPNVASLFIRCGETSGELDKSINYLCTYLRTLQNFYKAILQALFYPAMVFTATIGLMLFMLLFVAPQFESLYQQFNAPLPTSTQKLLAITATVPQVLKNLALFLLPVCLIVFYIYRYQPNAQYTLQKMLLHLPIVSSVLRYYQHAKFSRLLYLLLAAGVPLEQALRLLQETTQNKPLQSALRQTHLAVLQGQSLQKALQGSHYFELYLCDLIHVAEQSGRLDNILEQLANYYDERLKSQLERFKQILQPSMILFLGLLLGIWLLLLYYPLLQLGYAI